MKNNNLTTGYPINKFGKINNFGYPIVHGEIIMRKEQVVQTIYNDIAKKILNGTYPIGAKLPAERELSLKYYTSRIVIREVFATLSKAGMVETRPQSGTFIKDFYVDTNLDNLINLIKISKKIDTKTLKSIIRFFINNDYEITRRAAKVIKSGNLQQLETLILKKKLQKDPQGLAECDFEIFYEITKASYDPILIALSISMKPLRIMILKIVYNVLYKDKKIINQILDCDVNLFNALSEHDPEQAISALKMKVSFFEKFIQKIEKIENGTIYLDNLDDKKNKTVNI